MLSAAKPHKLSQNAAQTLAFCFAGIVYKKQRQYRIILSADTASEVRQMLSQKRR